MLLRNEESEFVQDDMGSLNDADLNSQSHSDDESNNEEKSSQPYNQATPVRQTIIQQATRYGELVMTSPDMQQRHTPFMPVYSQEDEEEVEIHQPNIGTSNQLSHRHSQSSDEDFYEGSQYSQGARLFPHDISHYGFPPLSQPSQQDLHHLNYSQSQTHYLHGRQYANDPYFYKAEDRQLDNSTFVQSKQPLSTVQKSSAIVQPSVPAQYIAYKPGVFQKLVLPGDQGESLEENAQPDFEETPPALSEEKLIKSADENNPNRQESNPIPEDCSKSQQSESCRVHSIIVNNESSATCELRNTRREHSLRISQVQQRTASPSKAQKKKTPQKKNLDPDSAELMADSEPAKVSEKKDQPKFKVVKGKRRTPRERKYFEKRKKMVEQAIPSVRDIGSIEWDDLVMKLSKLPEGTEVEKLNPYNAFNTVTFWFYISSLYFPKCYESTLKERLCLLVNFMRGDGSSKHWEKVFRDHPTFLRKSYRVYTDAKKRLNRDFVKSDNSQKKQKDQKRVGKEREPTEIEDLICQLEADQEHCALAADRLVSGLLDKIKSNKRPRLDSTTDEGQIRSLIQKSSTCQQALAFYQEIYSLSTKESLKFIALEESRYNEIKTQKLKQLREQYEKARSEGNKDYIMAEPVGKSFLGMLRNSYESCFICSGEEYDGFNQKIQCSVCEYFVHSECLGENVQNLQGDGDLNNSTEAVWTCQSCLVDLGLRRKFPGIDVSFKPPCAFCGLTGGLMRGTTSVLPDIRKTPGCNNITSWSASSTNGITLSNLTRKEKDYQIKLTEAKIKHWQDLNGNKPFPPVKDDQEMNSQDSDSVVTLPELVAYSPSFVYWVHMSCSQWILQKALVKKKPITLKQVPNQSPSAELSDQCEICGGANGLMQTCTYNKVRPGEDKMLESLYREFVQDACSDVANDKVAGEFLDELIEGGVCDGILHPQVNAKFTKGCLIDVCNTKMHIECARRAEYHMKYDPEVDQIEFLCSAHTPLPMHTELKQSMKEQVDNIIDFADSYQVVLKENQQPDNWTDKEKQELFTLVAETFFDMSRLSVSVARSNSSLFELANGPAELEGADEGAVGLFPGNQDWRITLNYHEFPWQSISVGHYDSIDCWKKFWELVGLSETRFRNLVMGTPKRNQARYQKFLRLRQQKISADSRDQIRIQKPLSVAPQPLPTEPEKLPEPVAEEAVSEAKSEEISEKIPSTEKPKRTKKKLTLRISQLQSYTDRIDRLRPRLDRTSKTSESKATPTPQQVKSPEVIPEVVIEPSSPTKTISTKVRDQKRLQKRKDRRKNLYNQLQKIVTCYCECGLTQILELKSVKKNSKQPIETLIISPEIMPPKFIDKSQEEQYMLQLNTPGTRFSKSGITRCSNKHDCKLGGYFHVECCYNADKKFDMKKKARDRWFCLACKEQLKAKESLNLPLNVKTDVQPEVTAQVRNEASEKKSASPIKEATHEEKSPIMEKRGSRRLNIKASEELVKPTSKRLKLEASPEIKTKPALIADNSPKALPNAEPIILISDPVPASQPKEAVVTEQSVKKPKKVKEETSLQGVPLIDDLLQQVESSLPDQISQQHQSVFQQLKNAIEKYKISMNTVPIAADKPQTEPLPLKQSQEFQEPKQPVYGEIEIKLDIVSKPVKQAQPKRVVIPAVEEKSKSPQKIAIAFDAQKTEPAAKLTLSQQFQLNLQRKQQAAYNEQLVQLPIQFKSEEPIQVPIQLKIEKQSSQGSKAKAKVKAEAPLKSQKELDVEMHNQPVTIAYFNHTQTVSRNEHTKSIQSVQQRNSNSSGSPPYTQNPLEPKLAAGPASGYPQQYNASQQNGMHHPSTYQQQEIQIHEQIRPLMVGEDSHMQTISVMTEAERLRKLEKRERKRQRKAERAERRRLEMEQSLINIETITPAQASFLPDVTNPSVVSICTIPMQPETLNLVQLSTTTAGPASAKPKKKSKKPKEKGVDIVIDTVLPPSMVSLHQPYNYIMPYEQANSISIPTSVLQNQVSIQMPTYQPNTGYQMQMPQFSIPQQFPHIQEPQLADDPFVISIPMVQPNEHQSEVVLKLGEGKKKGKKQQ